MSRRPSRIPVDTRQNDTLLEFETFKKKFLLANKHITKLNSTLSVRIEELNAQISTLYVENLRLRASEIALASQLKKEREKSRKVLDDAEAATHALLKQLGHIRKAHHVSRGSSSPEPEQAPAPPRARRPVIDPNASPPPNRIARAPTIPALFEEDEDEDDDHQASPTPRKRKSKSRPSSSITSSSSRLPLPARSSSPPPDGSSLEDFDEQLSKAGKKKPSRRQSGLLTASMSITTATPSGYKTEHITPRPPSPAFGSPLRRDAALEEEEDQVLVAMGVAVPDDEDGLEEPIAVSVTRRKRKSKDHDEDGRDEAETRKKEHDRRKSRYKDEEDESEGAKKERDKRRSREKDDGVVPSSYEGKKPKLKDVTNSPPPRPSLATIDTHDRERQRTPINDPSPSSATSSSHSTRTFLATSASKSSSPEPHLPTPRASSPAPPSESEQQTGVRERRVRKSINYAEPKLNTKMRKPDPPPPPPTAIKRSSSVAEHVPRRSLETAQSGSTESLASQYAAAGVKRKKSRVQVDDDESDGVQADGEYGVRAASAAGWVNDVRRRSVAASSSVPKRADSDSEGRRHSMAV